MGRTNYIGFFLDNLMEFVGTIGCFMTIISSASIYIGIFMYINGMAKDMKMQLFLIASNSAENSRQPMKNKDNENWTMLIQAVELHVEMIRSAQLSLCFSSFHT